MMTIEDELMTHAEDLEKVLGLVQSQIPNPAMSDRWRVPMTKTILLKIRSMDVWRALAVFGMVVSTTQPTQHVCVRGMIPV